MRRLFVLLMIVLMSLRAWAGDSMAVQMATSSTSSESSATMPPDCPMLMALATAASDVQDVDAGKSMPSCESCNLCLPIAEVTGMPLLALSFAAHVQRASLGASFVSAAPAPSFKPPIF